MLTLLLNACGCFSERSFPLRASDRMPVNVASARDERGARSTRAWLESADAQLRPLMPNPRRPTMTVSRMRDGDGRPRDVYAWFDRRREKMQGVFSNWWALQHTAQSIEHATSPQTPPPWPGFERVWIPVAPHVKCNGFLGLARSGGRVVEADCIIVLPGLWGDNGAKRSRDVSEALLRSGFHVLSIEPRGHGLTDVTYPRAPYTFGVLETQDLMTASEWLQDNYPQIRRTGLIGFCWGANAALLAAWYDGRSAPDPSIGPALQGILPRPDGRRHFEAGVMAFSPVVRWEDFLDRMDVPQTKSSDLSASMFQDATRDHMMLKGYPEASGSLRLCIEYDFAASELGREFPLPEGYHFLRLLPYRGLPAGGKMDFVRVPTLVVHGVNDPLMTAQEPVDLVLSTENPLVAGYILPGGGHIGFQAWSRKVFYSLVLGFFDSNHGAASGDGPQIDTDEH
jgi:predicted alpha/beta-fold hydrolase